MAKSGFAKEQLQAVVARIERVEEEIDGLKADKREIYAEAKGNGFDTKVLRQVIARRRLDRAMRQELDALQELYETALEGKERAAAEAKAEKAKS